MKTLAVFIVAIALFLIPGPGAHGAYRHFVFESPSDFEYYGFICFQDGTEVPCNIKQVENGVDLPAYFPATWHSLPGPLMYIESTIERFYFRLETKTALPGDIVSFNGEYYAESDGMIGCLNVTNGSPSHPWPAAPSTNPPRWYTNKWLYVPRPKLYKIGFFMYNDKATNLTVFRRLELVIDEEPSIYLRIESLEDATRHGVECIPECELRSAMNASYLPTYFSGSFRDLALPEGNVIMYVESVDNGGRSSRASSSTAVAVADYKLLVTLPVQFTQHPVGVLSFRSVYYTETDDTIGFGPLLWPDPDQWIQYDKSTIAGHWSYAPSFEFQPISNMIIPPNSKIGFFIKNDKEYEYAVFTRLEILVWFTTDSVISDPEPEPEPEPSTLPATTGLTSIVTTATSKGTSETSDDDWTSTTVSTSITSVETSQTSDDWISSTLETSQTSDDHLSSTVSTSTTTTSTTSTEETSQTSTSPTVSTTPSTTTTSTTTSTETSQTNEPTISTDSPTTTIRSTCPTRTTTTTITTCRSTPGTVDSTVSSEPEPTTLNQESTTDVFTEQSSPDATETATTLTSTTTLPSTPTITPTTITSDPPETTTSQSSAGIRVGINHWLPVVHIIIAPVFFALSTL